MKASRIVFVTVRVLLVTFSFTEYQSSLLETVRCSEMLVVRLSVHLN